MKDIRERKSMRKILEDFSVMITLVDNSLYCTICENKINFDSAHGPRTFVNSHISTKMHQKNSESGKENLLKPNLEKFHTDFCKVLI